ncbi:GNAT family N-acetyltransferase [Ruania sp. N2-46]|uniref:GNAT family N-acetyltransferase n=1 Tax=Occultella gossypii TaxID=2800820 RepID=A0ABS7S3S2_9MICO|nr:GNAT family N-acetyltransferase [Occultella gossypii]
MGRATVADVELRAYTDDDAAATLGVFQRAIRVTAGRDYTPEQIAVWAPADVDAERWASRRAAAGTVVAVVDGEVAGFTDLGEDGYIDMMFVDPAYARRGIATALLEHVVSAAVGRGLTELTVHASLTAKPFFERHGFVVDAQRFPVRGGVRLTNFDMRRVLEAGPVARRP